MTTKEISENKRTSEPLYTNSVSLFSIVKNSRLIQAYLAAYEDSMPTPVKKYLDEKQKCLLEEVKRFVPLTVNLKDGESEDNPLYKSSICELVLVAATETLITNPKIAFEIFENMHGDELDYFDETQKWFERNMKPGAYNMLLAFQLRHDHCKADKIMYSSLDKISEEIAWKRKLLRMFDYNEEEAFSFLSKNLYSSELYSKKGKIKRVLKLLRRIERESVMSENSFDRPN